MRISDAFPSDYLKASDLNDRSVTVIISKVELVELGKGRDKENKMLISFAGKQKQLVCNKTNANTIAKLYGDDTDGWIGKAITIEPREVEFQGDMVLAIRVSLKKPGMGAPTQPTHGPMGKPIQQVEQPHPVMQSPPPETTATGVPEEIDDVPF
jgi:hypothetical protein